ncbi:hypothetical protein CUJ86_06320 [Methanofollis fontis]|uniref:Uncharacterized protein n=1 Tax=Methanofollis fontis TaxID=2052832 RepID=A0A483CUA7_9EURY|nr:hypothetical protein CUJ86_06320 [Methanofollis fontis]
MIAVSLLDDCFIIGADIGPSLRLVPVLLVDLDAGLFDGFLLIALLLFLRFLVLGTFGIRWRSPVSG